MFTRFAMPKDFQPAATECVLLAGRFSANCRVDFGYLSDGNLDVNFEAMPVLLVTVWVDEWFAAEYVQAEYLFKHINAGEEHMMMGKIVIDLVRAVHNNKGRE